MERKQKQKARTKFCPTGANLHSSARSGKVFMEVDALATRNPAKEINKLDIF